MRHRRLTGAVLLLGMCPLLGAGRLLGQYAATPPAPSQREVIASSEANTPQSPSAAATPPSAMQPTPAAPISPAPGSPSPPPVAAPVLGTIQQVSFVPEPPPGGNGVSPSTPPAAPSSPNAPAGLPGTPMLPPAALLSGMKKSAPATTQPMTLSAATASSVSVEVVGPDQLLLGKPLVHEIVIRNTGGRPIAELHVEEPLPAGARALKTEPRALTSDNRLVWDLRNLEVGGERHLKVELNLTPRRGSRSAPLRDLPFRRARCERKVARPPFSVELSADHDKVPRGGSIRFTIRVANHGDAPVYNIHLYDQLPPGLHHPQGPKIGTDRFGDLLPGETRTITLETTAVQAGTFHNEVLAQADRGVESRAVLDVVITEPNLSLRLVGPAKTLTQHEVDFHLEAANPGSLPAKNVRLVQALPPTFEVVSASSGASLDTNRHALVWSLPDLTAGQRQTVTFRVKANLAGDWPLSAAVLSQNLPEARVGPYAARRGDGGVKAGSAAPARNA